MFGYIQINDRELSKEENRIYHAYRCGLCQCLRREFGRLGPLLLNHDMTFLAILLSAVYYPDEKPAPFTCAVHPGKKKYALINDAIRYVADMTLVTAYHNLQDDWLDDHSYSSRMMAGMLKKANRRILKQYPRQAKAISEYMHRTMLCEASREKNIDVIAGLAGDLFAEIFAWKEDAYAEELHCMGFYLGKFMYLMDAYDDMERDSKTRSYNPFLPMAAEIPEDYDTISRLLLTSLITECSRSFERMPVVQHAGIIRNVLRSGVWIKYEEIQDRHLLKKERELKKKIRSDRKLEKNDRRQIRFEQQKRKLEALTRVGRKRGIQKHTEEKKSTIAE